MANTEKDGRVAKKKYARRDKVKVGIQSLFEKQASFKGQPEIIAALKEIGIKANQSTVSRALNDLEIIRDENGEWVKDENKYKRNLSTLGQLFEQAGSTDRIPRLYTNVEVIMLRTMPNYNVLIANQIAATFPREVLSTFCPNNTDIIIYYRLRVKKTQDETSEGDKGMEESEPTEAAVVSEPQAQVSEGKYRKSRMRIEIVKLCKKTRKNREATKETKEESKKS